MKLLKLKDVCSVNSGISPPKDKKIFENGTVPFYKTLDVGRIKIGNISDSELKVSQAFADSKKVFEPGTILFPKSGASTLLNHRVVIQKKGLVASTLAAIVPIKDLCLSKYLYYYLLTIDAKDFIPESFYPGMKISEISEIPIPVPSLQEQEKIVERLDKVFENISIKIQLTEEKIIKINTMFTSFLNKVFNNHLTELNMESLDKLFNIQIGRTPPRGDKQLWDTKKTTNNIWLSIKDLNNIDENGFISDSFEYISKKAESSVPLVPENTLLLSFKLTLGRTAISKVPLRTNEAIAALLPKTNTYDINYLK